jgi:aminoglycoside phosphotransferase (APT) family kinase protein
VSDGDWAGSGIRAEDVSTAPEVVRALVAGQFPRWAELALVPVADPGMDNMTYRLGDDMLVRLPRYPRWENQVHREQRWLPVLAPHLPLAVPMPLAQGEPGAGYPFPWSVYEWLPGARATPETLADTRAAALALAGFLVALRGVDAAGGPPPEWSNGFRGVGMGDERDSPIVESRVRPKIAELAGLTDTDVLTELWEASLSAPPWSAAPVWVHGDPAPNNLLARGGELSAVIDFGTLAVGDPATDLIAAWTFVNAADREAFRTHYAVDDATWTRGRGWGMVASLPTAAQLSAPDPTESADARRRIDELVADYHRDLSKTG